MILNLGKKWKEIKMPNSRHNFLTDVCSKIFPSFLNHKQQMSKNYSYSVSSRKRKNPIPDLISPDKTLAVECVSFSDDIYERLLRYNINFSNLILVLPKIEHINEIWMIIDENNIRKYKYLRNNK